MHATFELHEQPNDQFKITWKISVTRGRPTNEREEKSTQPWAKEYAQNLYGAFVAANDPGDITALKLKIPTTLHRVYQNKVVLQRELISFAALASIANAESGLRPVLSAYADLLVHKMAERGLQMNADQVASAAFDDGRRCLLSHLSGLRNGLQSLETTQRTITYRLPNIGWHCLRPTRMPLNKPGHANLSCLGGQ